MQTSLRSLVVWTFLLRGVLALGVPRDVADRDQHLEERKDEYANVRYWRWSSTTSCTNNHLTWSVPPSGLSRTKSVSKVTGSASVPSPKSSTTKAITHGASSRTAKTTAYDTRSVLPPSSSAVKTTTRSVASVPPSSTTVTTTTPGSVVPSSTTSSSYTSPTNNPGDAAGCATIFVPQPGSSTQSYIYTGGYRGYGVHSNYTLYGYNGITYFDGTQSTCTAAQQCAAYAANGTPTVDASFDLHKQLSTNQWVCVAYPDFAGASDFSVQDPDVGAAYSWGLV